MFKRILYTGVAILFIPIILLSLTVLINSGDEDLSPEVKAILDSPPEPTANGRNAFFYLLGVRLGTAADPERRGRAYWERLEKMPREERLKSVEHQFSNDRKSETDVWPSDPFPVNGKKDEPFGTLWKENSEVQAKLTEIMPKLAYYLKLLDYGEIAFLKGPGLFSRTDVPVVSLLAGHRWLRKHFSELAAKGKWREIEAMAAKEARFYRSFHGRSYLLGTMIAYVIIGDDAALLAQLKREHPEWKPRPETLAAFQGPGAADSFRTAMNEELRVVHTALQELENGTYLANPLNDGSLAPFKWIKPSFGLRPNETLNRYEQRTRELIARPCEGTCDDYTPWWKHEYPWQWLRNPTGKFLGSNFMVQINGRMKKLEKREAQLTADLASLTQSGS